MLRRLATFSLVAALTAMAVTFWLQVDEPASTVDEKVDSRISKTN